MLRTGIVLIYEIESSEINSSLTVRFKGKALKDAERLRKEKEHNLQLII